MAEVPHSPTTILRLPQVQRKVPLSRSSIYLRVSNGSFPRPVSLGGRSVGWIESEIDDWLRQRIEKRRQSTAPERVTVPHSTQEPCKDTHIREDSGKALFRPGIAKIAKVSGFGQRKRFGQSKRLGSLNDTSSD